MRWEAEWGGWILKLRCIGGGVTRGGWGLYHSNEAKKKKEDTKHFNSWERGFLNFADRFCLGYSARASEGLDSFSVVLPRYTPPPLPPP